MNVGSVDIYFDSHNENGPIATTKGGSKYYWLYDNTYGCMNRGCNKEDNGLYYLNQTENGQIFGITGYWTSSPHPENNQMVLTVVSSGRWGRYFADYSNVGLRPVITISK